jgi:hypothetical protein
VIGRPTGTLLWETRDGVACLLVPYEGARYQLRLVRSRGTVKADLFAGYAEALAASLEWRRQFTTTRDTNFPSD